MSDPSHAALVRLGRWLATHGYRFTTATPESHARVNARAGNREARSLRDVFGWSRGFRPGVIPAEAVELLRAAGALRERDGLSFSTVRWSSLGDALYVHSAFPTTEADAVFFGPDTYRFAALLDAAKPSARHAVDIGCGSGAGGLSIAAHCARVTLADINPRALAFARVNAELAGVAAAVVHSDVLSGVAGPIDLVIANPPYLVDAGERLYRDGGGTLGGGLSVRIVEESLRRLDPGGRIILYSASAIVDGQDGLRQTLAGILDRAGAIWSWRELDPDVFGEELDRPPYADVDRIAVVVLDARVPT